MKTEVVMKRELFGREISQKSKSELFSATDLVKAGNIWRVSNGLALFDLTAFFSNKGTKEFVRELEKNNMTVKISGRGRSSHTWVHPFLFIDIALAISPQLKVEVYSWLYDHLLKYRNESGDSYKKMAGALFFRYPNKEQFPKYIQQVASVIRAELQAKDWNEENERTLKLRDKIHENIALLCDVIPCDDAVRIGIKKAMEE
jgi:hypothetical protein